MSISKGIGNSFGGVAEEKAPTSSILSNPTVQLIGEVMKLEASSALNFALNKVGIICKDATRGKCNPTDTRIENIQKIQGAYGNAAQGEFDQKFKADPEKAPTLAQLQI